MTSSKPDPKSQTKPPNPKPNSSTNWLSWGFICLLVGGTLAAKTVFLVDNDIEIKTKFAGQNWQLNSQSIKKYAADFEVSSRQYLQPWLATLDRESTHLMKQASATLANHQNWCVSSPNFATNLAPDNNSNSSAAAHPKVNKTARQQPLPTSPTERRWCFK